MAMLEMVVILIPFLFWQVGQLATMQEETRQNAGLILRPL
jgi:hypothetical protein